MLFTHLEPIMQTLPASFDFVLPPELEAVAPAELRGLRRDEVRLMVSNYQTDVIDHDHFYHLDDYLQRGDVLVINTSGTMNASLPTQRADGTPLRLHLSTQLNECQWVVELRLVEDKAATSPFFFAEAGETVSLPNGALAVLHEPYAVASEQRIRLWVASLDLGELGLDDYLIQFGVPIRYQYVQDQFPSHYYQTVYANEMGSAEMPSAGRAFTPELITRLVAKGVQIAPIILHTGVASLEADEPPYAEYYEVSAETAELVNQARQAGRRIIAVGTTAVRALETVTQDGITEAGTGWTELVITPERDLQAVNGMLTGFHEPRATHLAMLTALAGQSHIELTYQAALNERYLWHEFGDLHLILA